MMKTPTTSRSHILIRNTLWNFLSQGWFLILAFVTTPYIVRKLGTDAYGVLSIVMVVIGYFAFLDLGLGLAVIKYVSEYYAKKDYDTIRKIISTALVVYFLMGLIGAMIIASLTGLLVTKLLKIPSNLINISYFVFYISALCFLINMPLSVFGSLPKALQRFDIANKIKICFGTLQLLLTVFLLYLGYFLKQIVIMNLLVSVLSIFIYVIVFKRLLPQVRFKPTFDKNIFIKLFKFGGAVAVGRITVPIAVQLGRFLIGVFHPISLVTYFAVPYMLASKIWVIPNSIVSVIFPATSELSSQNQTNVLNELHLRSTKYIMIIVVPIATLLIVFARQILNLWMGPDFAIQSVFCLRILTLATLISSFAWTSVTAAQGAGRPDIPAKVQVLQAIINVILCFLLIPRWGINGVALAYLIHHIVGIPIIIGLTNKQVLKMSNLRFIKNGLGMPLIMGIMIPCFFAPFKFLIFNLTILLSLFSFIGIIYFLTLYFSVLDSKDKLVISSCLSKIRIFGVEV